MPIGDPTLFSQIEAELVDALQPILRPFDEDGLKQIEIEPFSSAEEISVLLQNFRSRIPGAYLSIPSVSYAINPAVAVPDITLEYAFLVGTEGVRAKTIDKKTAAYYFHDQFMKRIFFKRITNCEIPATLHPINPIRFEVASVESMFVTLTTFSMRASNWQIRELER